MGRRLIDACPDDVGGLLALPVADTLKRAEGGRVAATLPRADKWAAQTPQMFRIGHAARGARKGRGRAMTDDASAIEAMGLRRCWWKATQNLKVTWPRTDFTLAERHSRARKETMNLPNIRIGEGWDSHRPCPGRPLVLGGVTIPHTHGLDGHRMPTRCATPSPTRCFGALALGDIGHHFPDTDARFRGADSLALLAEAGRRALQAGWQWSTSTAPSSRRRRRWRRTSHAMRQRIAQALAVKASRSA